jgi:hypothetical protein
VLAPIGWPKGFGIRVLRLSSSAASGKFSLTKRGVTIWRQQWVYQHQCVEASKTSGKQLSSWLKNQATTTPDHKNLELMDRFSTLKPLETAPRK